MLLKIVLVQILASLPSLEAGHCYSYAACDICKSDGGNGNRCAWCGATSMCGMATDVCAGGLVSQGETCGEYVPPVYPGGPFFEDQTSLIEANPAQLNYGISVTDIDGDGQLEAVVAGFGAANLAFKWDDSVGRFVDAASGHPALQDESSKAIGVAACDVDGDGYEELYILNTDQYSGETRTSDRLINWQEADSSYSDMFSDAQNQGSANYVAGRSCACVDRFGTGKYEVMVANYGGPMKLFEVNGGGVISDVAASAGVAKTTGGRALIAGPIVSNRFDIFANNEGWQGRRLQVNESASPRRLSHRLNFFFVNSGDGTYLDAATALGLLDPSQTGRGTALLDSNGDGLLDIVYGNWNGPHRLFVQEVTADGCVQFVDRAPLDMAVPSRIRTVIVADWDNDGYEEIFWNNIPGDNRLFRKLPSDADWVQVNIGDAIESTGYGTGAAVGDFNGDGMLELFVSHGESMMQPVSYFRPKNGSANHWIRIMPQTAQGAPARGALVTLLAGDRRQTRVIDAGSGYLCQQEPVAHFGLGSLTAVESVVINWPDGTQHELSAPAIDQLHKIIKPTDPAKIQAAQSFSLDGNCLKRVGGTSSTIAPTPRPTPALTPASTSTSTTAATTVPTSSTAAVSTSIITSTTTPLPIVSTTLAITTTTETPPAVNSADLLSEIAAETALPSTTQMNWQIGTTIETTQIALPSIDISTSTPSRMRQDQLSSAGVSQCRQVVFSWWIVCVFASAFW